MTTSSAMRAGHLTLLQTDVCRTLEQLSQINDEWKLLLKESDADNLFLSWDWVSSWIESNEECELFVIIVRDSNQSLVGVAPFHLSPISKAGLSVRTLKFVGDQRGDSVGLGIICRSGLEAEVSVAILDCISTVGGWNVLVLSDLAENASTAAFIREIQRRKWSTAKRGSPHSLLALPETWGAFLQTLSRKRRAGLRRTIERLEGLNIRFERVDSAAAVLEAMEELFRLHTARWRLAGISGAFRSKQRREFYMKAALSALQNKTLDLWTARIEGNIVAVELGFVTSGRRVALQSGFDPRFARLRVGAALEAHVIQAAILAGVREYDFLGGDQRFKAGWGAQLREYTSVKCAPGGAGSAWVRLSESKVVRSLRNTLLRSHEADG